MTETAVSSLRTDDTTRGVLAGVGATPLVRLERLFSGQRRVFAKLEGLNPGGSIKDRPALSMIRHGIESGSIVARTVVIESSSGNLGVGLAQVCCYLGLRFICVVDPKTTRQNLAILRAYGAEIELVTEPDPETGEYLPARIRRVKQLLEERQPSFWPNQYANLANPMAHHQTMREIVGVLGGSIDVLFCAVSTCGTLRGCAEFVRAQSLKTRIVAVDAVGSVIFGGTVARRLVPGHGAALRPDLFRADLVDAVVHVSDLDCVIGCRRLAQQEAILAGGSSGAVVAAMSKLEPDLPDGATCVAVLADRGERYLDTIYSDAWVAAHFDPAEARPAFVAAGVA